MSQQHFDLRLATRRDGSRDGQLVLVSQDLRHCVPVPDIARTLQAALDNWGSAAPRLDALHRSLDAAGWRDAERFDQSACMAPLPRAYQWADASVYRNHARLIYKWRQEPIPPRYEDEPLVYQGGSDVMLGGSDPIDAVDAAHGIDLEAEIAVITTDVPMGVSAEDAVGHIALAVLLNDVSLRGLIPAELARGFGFYQSKPATSFAPVAVTPAALGDAWRDAMLHLPVRIRLNDQWFGHPDAGEETVFHFGHILAHLARTRALGAGSIVGAGTISNADPAAGNACITEARVRQMLDGVPEHALHPYLANGDRVRIEVLDANGASVFGAIDQRVRIAAR
ncbi:fumarylacetoacetate hydrolase family protein [Cupriavidus sp. BIS7]|uniref:fumarylacetoacetate hydrolase family protein n=1 Tax=Cupriavidus sp. BIS7 TaxID=1217718 RepID=UPI0002FFFFB2|nr:fumarylacetoacetate hydrolase family protein [Cupriavidus sp. BIS7]